MKQNRLSAKERKEVLAFLSLGCSRATAARSIRRTPRTIRREILECPKFAAQVAKAEEGGELVLLSNVRKASQDARYWRAGAWLLERRLADRFGLRKPETLTDEHVQKFMSTCMKVIVDELPDKEVREKILNRLAEELEE